VQITLVIQFSLFCVITCYLIAVVCIRADSLIGHSLLSSAYKYIKNWLIIMFKCLSLIMRSGFHSWHKYTWEFPFIILWRVGVRRAHTQYTCEERRDEKGYKPQTRHNTRVHTAPFQQSTNMRKTVWVGVHLTVYVWPHIKLFGYVESLKRKEGAKTYSAVLILPSDARFKISETWTYIPKV
jgi:hypothetical protein